MNVIYNLTEEIKVTDKYNNLSYEEFFPPKLKNIKLLDKIGITQNISVWDDKTNY